MQCVDAFNVKFTELTDIVRKALWLSIWTIHNAYLLCDKADGIKEVGHQATCTAMVTPMSALFCHALRPQDRVAVKLHAAPVFRALQYLSGVKSTDKPQDFRALGLAKKYPSQLKDTGSDGHSATLSWLRSVHGHRTTGLGVEHFGQTGTVADLYRHFGIDRNSILSVVENQTKGRPLQALGWT